MSSEPIIIALDYDGTVTRDHEFWLKFIEDSHNRGHIVYLVTMRYPHEESSIDQKIKDAVKQVILTSRHAKRAFCSKLGIHPHIWIDDQPDFILLGALK